MARHDHGAQALWKKASELDVASFLTRLGVNPTANSLRSTVRDGRALSGTYLDLEGPYVRCGGGTRLLEVQLESFPEVGQRLVLAAPLARHVHVEALRNDQFALARKARAEPHFHGVTPNVAGHECGRSHLPYTDENGKRRELSPQHPARRLPDRGDGGAFRSNDP